MTLNGYTSPGHVPAIYRTPDTAVHVDFHNSQSDAIDFVAAGVPDSINDFPEVDMSGATDGQVATWDATAGKLKPKPAPSAAAQPVVDWFLVNLCAEDGTVTVSNDAYAGGAPIYRACKLDELHPTCDPSHKPSGGSATGYVYKAGSGLSSPIEDGTATIGGGVGVSSSTIAYPAAVTAGRVARIYGFHANKATTVTTPSGWTARVNYTEGTGSDYGRIFCFEKVLTGSETGTVTITTSTSTDISTGMIIDDGENTTAGPVVGSVTFSFTSSLTIPGVTPSSNNDRLVAAIGQAGNPFNYAQFPAGWTKLLESQHGNSCIAVGAKTSGTTTPASVTVNLTTSDGTTASTLNEMGFELALQATSTPLASFSIGEGASIGHFTALGKPLAQFDQLHYAVTNVAGCKGLKLLHKLIDP